MTADIEVVRELNGPLCRLPTSSLGQLTVGPEGLLDWLESQLGLQRPKVSFTTRMVQYLTCLQELDNPERFYHESLGQDEFGVARTLLQWRDAWYEAGWDGRTLGKETSNRLFDLCEVERLGSGTVEPGLGQRVQLVSEALAANSLDVSIVLLDPSESFPSVWQRLFEQLDAKESLWRAEPRCEGRSDLALLQRALIAQREPNQKVQLAGDGSVLMLRDGSPQLSAPWIARFSHQQLDDSETVAILAMGSGAALDDALSEAGYPRLGFLDPSYWRPVFQILPLSLELLWRPLDPAALLQFLAHPMGPVPGLVRRRLSEVVAREPGIGGDNWEQAVEAALDDLTAKADEKLAKEKRERIAEAVDFWLNCERFDPQPGVALAVLKSRIRAVGAWLTAAWASQEDEPLADLYSAALGQCDELERIIDRLIQAGKDRLTRESVRRLVEAVRGSGESRPGRSVQCDPDKPQLLRAVSPAGVTEPTSTVIWWGCGEQSLPSLYPWSRSEIAGLAAHGVALQPVKDKLEWQAGTWLRPILSAKERLVFVLHDSDESHHPILDQVTTVAKGWVESRVSKVMGDPGVLPLKEGLPKSQKVTQQSLPPKTRWWQLPEGVSLAAREVESYSSLEKFIYGPYQWVLNYKARIRPGVLADLSDGPLLMGSLAHSLFEQFFRVERDIQAIDLERAKQWAEQNINDLIEKCGAVLLMPGRQAEKEDFVDTVSRALVELIKHLQSANVVDVAMEEEYLGRFCGGPLQGKLDLHVTNATGESAVVDIKWGGLKYRKQTLREGSYLQLAVYAVLFHHAVKRWPALANFIIRDAQMLVLESDFFPHAAVVHAENGESLLQFWQRVESTWQWRRAQLDRGLIEVTVTDTEPDERSGPGEQGLPMPETFDAFDDYVVLTGWSAKV